MRATPEQLAIIRVFSSLESSLLVRLAQGSQIHSYQRGEIIIHEGDLFKARFHGVLRGKLSAQKVTPAGKETILRQLSQGEMFAAPALFGDLVAPATVVVLQDTKVITVDKAILIEAIQIEPEIALQILSCFNQRLQEMHQTIHGLISERAIVRLVRLIIYTARRYGLTEQAGEYTLNNRLSYQQMARMIGITYEECVRLMKKDLGVLVSYRRGGKITLKSLASLEKLLESLD